MDFIVVVDSQHEDYFKWAARKAHHSCERVMSRRPPLAVAICIGDGAFKQFRLAINKQVFSSMGTANIPERIFLYADDVILFSSPAE